MAVIWRKQQAGVLYEVRAAGNTRRLYTDGVFHSQYNPRQLLTGHVWDLLMLPAHFYPAGQLQRILVLGVGGGAVIHQLQHFISPCEVVGVELNPLHISVGRRFFSLNYSNLDLIQADAVSWLEHYQGPAFDMIIDDLFAEEAGEPVAVTEAGYSWFNLMLRHLSPSGMVVRNFIDRQALLQSAPLSLTSMRRRFKSAFQLTSFYNENFVGAFLRQEANSAMLRQTLQAQPQLDTRRKSCRLRYRIRQLM